MDKEQYQSHLVQAYMVCEMAKALPVEEMVDMISRSEAIVPLLDPTLFKEKGKAAAEDKELLQAVAALKARFLKMEASHQ